MLRTRFHASPFRVRSMAVLGTCSLALIVTGLAGTLSSDTDGDGIPNASDADIDNDKIPKGSDRNVDGGIARSGPFAGTYVGDRFRNADPRESDIDGDGFDNEWDADADGDGIEDAEEQLATGFWEEFDDASRWPDGATIDHSVSAPLIGIPWRISIAGGPKPTVVHAHSGLTPQNGNTLFYLGGSANSAGGKMTLAFEATAIPTDALPGANQDLGCNVSFLNFSGIISDNGGIDPTGVVHTSFNGFGTTGPSIYGGESFTCLGRANFFL